MPIPKSQKDRRAKLKQLRLAAGLTQTQAGVELEWGKKPASAKGIVSHLECGHNGKMVRAHHLEAMGSLARRTGGSAK